VENNKRNNLPKKKSQNNQISLITDEQNHKIIDKTRISDLLNNHFTSVGPNKLMNAKIPSTTKFFGFSSLPNSFVFDSITEDEVYSQILQLNSKKSSGPENILIKFFRILASIISPYLKDAYNLCYETGTFPIA